MGRWARSQKIEERAREARSRQFMESAEYNKYLLARMAEVLAVAALAAAAAAVLILPGALGYGLHRAAKDNINRREQLIIGGAVSFLIVWYWPAGIDRYASWVWNVGPGVGDPWDVPALTILAIAVLVAVGCEFLIGSKIWNLLPAFGSKLGDDSLVPSDKEKARIEVVKTPTSASIIDPLAHTMKGEEAGDNFGSRTFTLGVDRHGKPFQLSEKELRTHAMLLGSTGSGKTETAKTLVGALLSLGWDGVIVDLKEDLQKDEGLRDFCRMITSTLAEPYQEVTLSEPDSPQWFNALQGLTPTEATNAILSMQEFEAPYYKALNEKLLGQLCTLFFDAHAVDPERFPYPDIYSIGNTLSKPLKAATKTMRAIVLENLPGRSEEDFAWLKDTPQEVQNSAPGLGARLTSMYETEAGRTTLRPQHPQHQAMDVTAGGLCYIGLNSLGMPVLSKTIAAAALLRIAALAGARTTGRTSGPQRPKFLFIDEANTIPVESTLNVLARARSAGIAVILGTQSPMDFDRNNRYSDGGGSFAQLAQNTNVSIIMGQADRESAEVCADYLGTSDVAKLSERVRGGEKIGDGMVQFREEHKVPPQQLTELQVGEAIVKVRTPGNRLSWVKVNLTDPHRPR